MAVLPNRIVIGSLVTPLFSFENDEIEAPDGIESVDIIGEKLPIDTFSPIVHYSGENIDQLRLLPFGTPVWHYNNGSLIRKFYIRSVERQTKTAFKLDCISVIGILDKQYHTGDLYRGKRFDELMAELLGPSITYEIDSDVASTKIFGWLPYATKRDNLHQVLFATNASIVKNADGDMRFTFLKDDGNPGVIEDDRVYMSGSVTYPTRATEVNLVEHSYQYVDTLEPVTLIDNTSEQAQTNKLYIFDNAPIYVDSLVATGTLEVVQAGTNYAIITGSGTLTGIPYFDRTSIVTRKVVTGGEDCSVSVEDATLVTVLNSENIVDRLSDYYTSEKTIKGDIKLSGEKTGRRYTFHDAFGEQVTAYLGKMTSYASSFIKAACEFIAGYISNKFGNNYTDYIEADEPCDIVVPDGCSILKFYIIGGGDGGDGGFAGELQEGWDDDGNPINTPSKAGDPGEFGFGGKIREVTIHNPEAGNYHCTIGDAGKGGAFSSFHDTNYPGEPGSASTMTTPSGTVYSSDDASYRSENGIVNIFTGKLYGRKGLEGVKGGEAGYGSNSKSEDGEDVTYKGKTLKGGKGTSAVTKSFNHIDQTFSFGAFGGCGATAFSDGLDALPAYVVSHVDETTQRGAAAYEIVTMHLSVPNTGGSPLDGDDTSRPYYYYTDYRTERGCGGDAGCGGFGIGGNSSYDLHVSNYYNQNNKLVFVYDTIDIMNIPYNISAGLPGRDGGRGIIIAYADKPLTIANRKKYSPPRVYNVSNPSIGYPSVAITDYPDGCTLYVERKYFNRNYPTAWINNEILHPTVGVPTAYASGTPGATECFRVKVLGNGEYGESDWSDEVISAGHKNQITPLTIDRLSQVIYDDKPGLFFRVNGLNSGDTYLVEVRSDGVNWRPVGVTSYKVILVTSSDAGSYLDIRCIRLNNSYMPSNPSNILSGFYPYVTSKLNTPAIYGVSLNSDVIPVVGVTRGDNRAEKVWFEYNIWDGQQYVQNWQGLGSYTYQSQSSWNAEVSISSGISYESGKTYVFRVYISSDKYGLSSYSNTMGIRYP